MFMPLYFFAGQRVRPIGLLTCEFAEVFREIILVGRLDPKDQVFGEVEGGERQGVAGAGEGGAGDSGFGGGDNGAGDGGAGGEWAVGVGSGAVLRIGGCGAKWRWRGMVGRQL